MMTIKKPPVIVIDEDEKDKESSSNPPSGPVTVRNENERDSQDFGLDLSPFVEDDSDGGSDDDCGPDFSYLQPTGLDSE